MSEPKRIKFTVIDVVAIVMPCIAYGVFIFKFVPDGREYRLSGIASSIGIAVSILLWYKLRSSLKISQTVIIRLAPTVVLSAVVGSYVILRAVLPPFEPQFERVLAAIASVAVLVLLCFFTVTRARQPK